MYKAHLGSNNKVLTDTVGREKGASGKGKREKETSREVFSEHSSC